LTCSPPSRTVFYSHGTGFRIAVPAGWTKTAENDRLVIFCCDNRRLIEAGGYPYPLTPSKLARLPDRAADSLVVKFGLDQLAVFAEEKGIRDIVIDQRMKTDWAGHPSYLVQARGWSAALGQNVAIDIRMLLHKENATFYFLRIMVPAQDYAENASLIRNVIDSYQILD
jgi:hypothetical protein